MTTTHCPVCRGKLPEVLAGAKAGDAFPCPHCGTSLQVRPAADIGAQTIFQPQQLAEGLEEEPVVRRHEEAGTGEVADEAAEPPGTGTVLLSVPGGEERQPPTRTAVRGYLILVAEGSEEQRLPLADPRTVVGRGAAEVDIEVDDASLSSRHFEIEVRKSEFFIRDLDSRNGTWVNGSRIRAVQLSSGDTIGAGRTRFLFRAVEVVPWSEGS